MDKVKTDVLPAMEGGLVADELDSRSERVIVTKCNSLISGLTISMINEDDKLKGVDDEPNLDFSAAFLGPVLWEKTLPFDEDDFKLENLGLQEFFDENDLLPASQPTVTQPERVSLKQTSTTLKQVSIALPDPVGTSSLTCHASTDEEGITLVSIPGQEGFDPRKRKFTEEELKPQPLIKKSKKVCVPDGLKDDAYWQRRNKNNTAAKRSRDARRVKENQIAMRAAFLESENGTLKSDLEKVRLENAALKELLSRYEAEAKQ